MKRTGGPLSKFHKDESGAVFIWATILILVIVAVVGLAVDGARYMHLNSNMQQIADAAALAGAKELNGSMSSITNATNAAQNYLKNQPGWSDDGSAATTQILPRNFSPRQQMRTTTAKRYQTPSQAIKRRPTSR